MPPTDAPARGGSSRAAPLALLAIAAVLLIARIGFGVFENIERPVRADLVRWREPGPLAEAEARRTGKPLLYDFTAEWCAPCRQLQDEVFADSRWAAKINAAYVPVRVLDRRREEGRNPAAVDTLQLVHQVQAFPTLVVSSPDGARREKLEGWRGGMTTTQWLSMASLKVMGVMPEGGKEQP